MHLQQRRSESRDSSINLGGGDTTGSLPSTERGGPKGEDGEKAESQLGPVATSNSLACN